MNKNFWIGILAIVLVYMSNSMVAAQASPASHFTYDLNKEGDGVIIKRYTGTNQNLIFPREIEGYPVVQIGEGEEYAILNGIAPNMSRSFLVSVVIPEGIKIIAAGTFFGQNKLTDVTFPVSLVEIGEQAFSGSHLTRLSFPVGSNLTVIDNSAFFDNPLTSVDLSNTTLTTIGYSAFEGNYKTLRTVKLPDSVTTIGEMAFDLMSNLTDINIPTSIESIGRYAFRGCTELVRLTIPASITSIIFKPQDRTHEVFNGCGKLPLATRQRLRNLGYTGEF